MNRSYCILFISISLLFISCQSTGVFKEKWTKIEAPATFKARFETTKGDFPQLDYINKVYIIK